MWKQVPECDPGNRRARDSYKKALVQMADWDGLATFFDGSDNAGELVRLLESQVGVQSDSDAKLELLFRAADLYLNELEQSDKAVRTLERVLQVDATNQRAAQMLEPIYRSAMIFVSCLESFRSCSPRKRIQRSAFA